MTPECAFEPDAIEVRCVECGKPTGLMGTCQDVDFCAACKEDLITASMHDGLTRAEAEAEFSAILISQIEGVPYNVKYVRHRVLHVSIDNKPACGAKGGPHPLTTNKNESNCKRCLRKMKANETH